MKIGFIGCGNMGGALAHAAMLSVNPWHISVTDKDEGKAMSFAEESGAIYEELDELASTCKYIFLGVKPQVLPDLAQTLAPILKERTTEFTVVSMLAGVRTEKLKGLLGDCPVIRIMPNLAVSAGEGMILYTSTPDVSKEALSGFLTFMSKAGKFLRLDEDLFDAGTSVSGCGPAFVCQFLEGLTEGGVRCGLSYEDSLLLAEQTLLGTAKLLLETGREPSGLRVAVCSPGGSTIEGVKTLENKGITETLCDTVNASYKRNMELGKG